MTTTTDTTITTVQPTAPASPEDRVTRLSTRFGVVFSVAQIVTMLAMAIFVLPQGGSPGESATAWGHDVLDSAQVYRVGNFVFMVSGVLLLGFLGAVHVRLRRIDGSATLATIAVAAGGLLALVWPMAGMLHDVALDVASKGTDVRILAGWDSVAPYSLAFSALPRIFFVGAIVLALRIAGSAPKLQKVGLAIIPLSLLGSATTVVGAAFPVLGLSSLVFELWVGFLAWHWLRNDG
jgi:hypothetical protein